MRKRWLLRNGTGAYVVARRADVFPEELCTGETAGFLAHIEAWLADPLARQTMLEIYECSQGRGAVNVRQAGVDELRRSVRPWLEAAFRRRELIALPVSRSETTIRETVTENIAPARTPPPPVRQKTWVEIELVDEEGNRVPRQLYRLALPDGSVEEGFLDDAGRARVEGIDPGTCKVSFPEIDAAEWRAA
ncbi:MAG: hypothetical protein ACRDTR_22000 [Rubrobacter sp.]